MIGSVEEFVATVRNDSAACPSISRDGSEANRWAILLSFRADIASLRAPLASTNYSRRSERELERSPRRAYPTARRSITGFSWLSTLVFPRVCLTDLRVAVALAVRGQDGAVVLDRRLGPDAADDA